MRTKLVAGAMGRRAFWSKASGLRLTDVPAPELPGEGWVRCRTRLGGICGTDLAMLTLRQAPDSILQGFSSMPLIPGHENVAEVVEVHPSLPDSWIGRRVCVEPTLGCEARGIVPPCPRCAAGEFGACENFGAAGQGAYALPAGTSIGYNARTGGSWGEQFVAHVSQLVPLPESIPDIQAVLTDPLACSLHSVLRTNLSGVNTVCVYGGGIIGLGIVGSLRASGYQGQIDILARHPFQQELALRMGASNILRFTGGELLDDVAKRLGGQVVPMRFGVKMLMGGYDVVYDCVGSPWSTGEAMKLARARGQVVMVGTSGGGRTDLTPIWFRELNVVGAYGRQIENWQGRRIGTYQLVHELMLAGKLPTQGLLTHTFPLADFRHAFVAATGKKRSACIRAAFTFR